MFKEGDKVDKIYIIRYGEFKFTKNYKLEYRVDNNKRTRLKQWRDKFTKLKQLQLYIKSSHDIFGFEDFKDNFNYRSMTCTCISF